MYGLHNVEDPPKLNASPSPVVNATDPVLICLSNEGANPAFADNRAQSIVVNVPNEGSAGQSQGLDPQSGSDATYVPYI